eukprot:Gb_38912 [translate_table: standard]
MKKMVLKLEIHDESSKRKALKVVAGVEGVDSVSIDMKEKKITVIGEADPVFLTGKLRKFGHTELESVGPAKEEKKDEKKNEKAATPPTIVYLPSNYGYSDNVVSDENPNACVIC